MASLKNKQVSRRTLWINADLIEDILGGVRESFGEDFEFIKVIVEAQDIDSAKMTVSKDEGLVVELKNKFVFENPIVTIDESADDADGAEMPFMEMELSQKLSVNF